METTSSHEAGPMAAWRATGGAGDALREAAGEDERLAGGGISRNLQYCGGDGLEAGRSSGGHRCYLDDGLEAGGRYTSFGCLLIDDGLAATAYTSGFRCLEDGLAAGLFSGGQYCFLYDGLKAGYRTGFGCYRGDDGLSAIPAATHPLFCRVDDGLAAGGYASTIGAFCW